MKIKDLIWKENTGDFQNREFQFEAKVFTSTTMVS